MLKISETNESLQFTETTGILALKHGFAVAILCWAYWKIARSANSEASRCKSTVILAMIRWTILWQSPFGKGDICYVIVLLSHGQLI